MKKILFFLSVLICVSCTENEKVNQNYEEALTVEGYVKEGELIRVYLTTSLPFLGKVTRKELLKIEESTAKVVVSDGVKSEILTLKRDPTVYPNLYYETQEMKGFTGVNYSLEVFLKGEVYTATTKVPTVPKVKSIKVIDGIKEGKKAIQLKIENNKELAYYKILIKDEQDDKFAWAKPYLFSTELISENEDINLVLRYVELVNGVEEDFITSLNTYTIQLVRISKSQHDFFKSIYGDSTSLINVVGFSENIESNIDGGKGVLGFWAGENAIELEVFVP